MNFAASRFFTLISLVLPAILVVGCGDDTRPMTTSDAGMDTTTTDGGGTDTPVTDAGEVPAESLGGDPMTACPAGFQDAAPPVGSNSGFMVAGQSRDFVLILPDASFTGPRPLFVGLNGTGESGPSFTGRARLAEFAARGFIVLAPSSNMNGRVWPVWDDMRQSDDHARPNADLDLFDQLVACTGAHFDVDKNRIYVGGHSAGGIFTNAVVQRRSELLAGAIVASGILDLTSPPDLGDLDPLFVLVTWGGDNDAYGGGGVPEINFVEQASNSTIFYDMQPNVGMASCVAEPGVGHAWLPINDWMIDRLLEHPKGNPGNTELTIPAGPPGTNCTTEPVAFTSSIMVECGASTTANCQEFCQFTADCTVENATVGPVVQAQLAMLGFSGTDNTDCTGCMTWCEGEATTAADTEVLDCITTSAATNMCTGGGIAGFNPYPAAVDGCCDGRSDSNFCLELCGTYLTLSVAPSFFPNCVALLD